MELIKENVTVNQVVCKGSTQAVVDEDIIVPDIKPDILKILQLDAEVCVTDKKMANGSLIINGRVDLKILYVPDSECERVKSIITSYDFEERVDCRDDDFEMIPLVASNVDRAEFYLTNSRKLRVKVVVGIDYEVISKRNIEVAVNAEDTEKAQLLRENVNIQNCVGITEQIFDVNSAINIPNGQSSINEILKLDAKILNSEYKTVTGKIVIKGEMNVCVLYADEECRIQFTESEIPFTEVIECDEASDETICDIDYGISDITYRVCEDTDGDKRIVEMEAKVLVQVKATETVTLDMVCDCYEPSVKTELIKEEMEVEEVVSRPSTQNTIREVFNMSDAKMSVVGVYNAVAKPSITKIKMQDGKLSVEGKIEVYILYLTENEESPVAMMKKDMPFGYMLDCDGNEPDLLPEVKAEVKHIAYNLNAAGEIEIRCILSLNANVMRKRKIELVEEVITEKNEEADNRGIVIYFVQNGDDLWKIGKCYAVAQEDILKFNNMTDEEELEIGRRLLIPSI